MDPGQPTTGSVLNDSHLFTLSTGFPDKSKINKVCKIKPSIVCVVLYVISVPHVCVMVCVSHVNCMSTVEKTQT